MRSNKHALFFDGLEDRCVMSHVVVSPLHAIPHLHKPAIVSKPHVLVVHQVTSSFGARHGLIVHHSSLQAAAVKAAQGTSSFGGGNVDFTIPFIVGTTVGAPQNALNFTSNTYNQVLFGGGDWDGIQQIADRFGDTGDVNQLNADITALSFRMPYGNQMLLPTWKADLQSLQAGTLTPTRSGITWDFDSTSGQAQAVGDVLFQDLQTYLSAGLGTSFNILQSNVNWNSDNLLTYNGFVGSNSLT
jgi:hypothetical protein